MTLLNVCTVEYNCLHGTIYEGPLNLRKKLLSTKIASITYPYLLSMCSPMGYKKQTNNMKFHLFHDSCISFCFSPNYT